MPNLIHQDWEDKQVTYENFKSEVVNKAKFYVNELRVLNNENRKDILNLESLIMEIEK